MYRSDPARCPMRSRVVFVLLYFGHVLGRPHIVAASRSRPSFSERTV